MELKTFFAQDTEGNVIPDASVFLYLPDTTELVTGLEDRDGNDLANPFNADSNGKLQLAAPDGQYDLRVSSAGRDYTVRVRFLDLNGVVIYRDSIQEMESLPTASLPLGQLVNVNGSEYRWNGADFVPTKSINLRAHGATGDGTDDETAFDSAEAAGEDGYVDPGTYDARKSAFGIRADYASRALFKDDATGEYFPVCHGKRLNNLRQAFQDVVRMHDTGAVTDIVCYGDSNTRYYRGDDSEAGPYSKAYGAWVDYLCTFEPHMYGASVTINGYPGQTAEYGDTNYDANVPSGTDILVLGFGTNNVKLASPDLDGYLSAMRSIISKALADRVTPIVLGIPWYSSTYGDENQVSQDRIRVWNAHLYQLCMEVGVHFIDTYSLTYRYPSAYFNESSLLRHYNETATRAIGAKVIEAIKEIKANSEVAQVNMTRFNDLGFVKSVSGLVERRNYTIGGKPFQALKIPPGGSITFEAQGRGCIALYPRESATANITTPYQTTNETITPVVDGGEYYNVQRVPLTFSHEKNAYEITIGATGGNVYLRAMSFLDGLRSPIDIYNLQAERISGADMPASAVPGRRYIISEIEREARREGSNWFGPEGLYIVGDNADRTAVENSPCPLGYKFYNTDTGQGERWDGTAWTAV